MTPAMQPRTIDDQRHRAVIRRAEEAVREDERIRAAWLEGSFADGSGGPWSDIDLHLAVPDEQFEAFCREAVGWLERLGRPHGLLPGAFGPVRLFGVTLEGGVRVDLFVEATSRLAEVSRPVAPRVLLDRDGLAARFDVRRPAEMEAAAQIRRLVAGFFFGYTWPARLAGREEWGSMLLNALLVVYQFIVPAILAQERPEHAYRFQLHNERFLPPARRGQVDALVAALAAAFAPLASGRPDLARVAEAHRLVVSALLREMHAACAATGVEWPADAERALRAFYRDELGIVLDRFEDEAEGRVRS